MIIKRKYATYGQLFEDEASKNTITRIFDKYEVRKEVYDYILDKYNDIIVMNTDMGSGIPGQAYQELRQAFDELDVTKPYDNGLTYRDATNVFMDYSREGSAIIQILYRNKVDMPKVIVQVVAFEYKDGKTVFIEPWNIEGYTI